MTETGALEYMPYFPQAARPRGKYPRPGTGESGFTPTLAAVAPGQRRIHRRNAQRRQAGPLKRSLEYGADIIEAIEGGRPPPSAATCAASAHRNLLDGVEVECDVNRGGIQRKFGALPEQLAASIARMSVHRQVVRRCSNAIARRRNTR